MAVCSTVKSVWCAAGMLTVQLVRKVKVDIKGGLSSML